MKCFRGFGAADNTSRYSYYEHTFTKVYILTLRGRLLGDTIKRFNIMPIIGTSQPHILTVNFKKKTIKRTVNWIVQPQIQMHFHHLPEVIDYDSNMRLWYRCKANHRKLSMVSADIYDARGQCYQGRQGSFSKARQWLELWNEI